MTRLEKLEALWEWLTEQKFEGGDIDGGDFQNKALELDLLREVPYDPQKHGNYTGEAWDLNPGDPYIEVVKEDK